MYIDSHAHLTDEKLIGNLETILERAKKANVEKIITIGTNLQDNENVLKIIAQHKNIYASLGIYPDEMKGVAIEDLETSLLNQLEHKKVLAVGETGIDIPSQKDGRINDPIDLIRQIDLFEMQIAISIKKKLPLVIHNRNADKIVLEILNKYKNQNIKGVFHCFTSSWEIAKQILDLGFYISFSGIITFPSASEILETVLKIPNDRFLVETDAPYLTPVPFRKEINAPEYVKITTQKVAETKNISLDTTCEFAYKNTQRLFFEGKNV